MTYRLWRCPRCKATHYAAVSEPPTCHICGVEMEREA